MNFLGMGPMELMLILVLALIVFGPGKLPEVAGQVGKAVRDVRRATSDLSSEFNKTINLELDEKKETQAAASATAPADVSRPSAAGEASSATVSPAKLAETSAAASPASSEPEGSSAKVSSETTGTDLSAEPPSPQPKAEQTVPTEPQSASGTAPDPLPPLADTSRWAWEEAHHASGEPGSSSSVVQPTAPPPAAATEPSKEATEPPKKDAPNDRTPAPGEPAQRPS